MRVFEGRSVRIGKYEFVLRPLMYAQHAHVWSLMRMFLPSMITAWGVSIDTDKSKTVDLITRAVGDALSTGNVDAIETCAKLMADVCEVKDAAGNSRPLASCLDDVFRGAMMTKMLFIANAFMENFGDFLDGSISGGEVESLLGRLGLTSQTAATGSSGASKPASA